VIISVTEWYIKNMQQSERDMVTEVGRPTVDDFFLFPFTVTSSVADIHYQTISS
jgi:hypothetical protein